MNPKVFSFSQYNVRSTVWEQTGLYHCVSAVKRACVTLTALAASDFFIFQPIFLYLTSFHPFMV